VKVCYITAQAPYGRGETFILEEMLCIKELGVDLLVFPRNPVKEVFHKGGKVLVENAVWLPLITFRMFIFFIISLSKVKLWFVLMAILKESCTWWVRVKNFAVVPKSVYVASLLRRRKVDHIHAHWGSTTATMAWIISELTGIPWSFTLHRWDITENNLLREKVESAEFVRCISECGKSELLEIIGKKYGRKIKMIHVGVKVSKNIFGHKERRSGHRKFRIVTPANLLEVKGHKYLIEACSVLMSRGVNNFQCTFYGEGPLRSKLEVLVEEKRLNNYVQMPGAIPHEKLMMQYEGGEVDAVILPSITTDKGEHEGIPTALMEAMAYGVPVVSTNTGGIPELLSAGAGIIVEEKNSRQLADAIENLVAGGDLLRRLGQKGYERVRDRFNIHKNTAQLLELFR